MIGLRIANIAKKIAEDIENKYIYDPDHENKPQDGGDWHETPKGWSTYDVENRKFNDDEEINKETTIRIRNVDSDEEFSTIISKARETVDARNRWRVDAKSPEDYKGTKKFVSKHGGCVAVTPDSDIVSVCCPTKKERGHMLLKLAVANGGKKLDAFGPRLYDFYTRNGFEPVSCTDFDEQYAPDGWEKGVDKKEPIVFYVHTGKPYTEKTFDEFVSSVEHKDYDVAYAERDNILKQRKGEQK